MLIILFRHGPAGSADASRWKDDSERPLTPKGEDATRDAALGVSRLLGQSIDAVLTSPFVRAASTAKILASANGCKKVETVEALAPGGSYRKTLGALAAYGEDDVVALVGHEPDLGKLAGVLVFGAPSALRIKKAGACAIACEAAPLPGAGTLRWFVPPRVLRKLARKKSRAPSPKKAKTKAQA